MDSPGGFEVFHSLENLHLYLGFQVPTLPQELDRWLRSISSDKLRGRLSMWTPDFKRLFYDSTFLWNEEVVDHLQTFCFSPRHQHLRFIENVVLFFQIYDSQSSVPLVESTHNICLSNIAPRLRIRLYESSYFASTLREKKQFEVDLIVRPFLSLREVDASELQEKWQINENVSLRLVSSFPQPYLQLQQYPLIQQPSYFMTVLDVNLSEDILELYKTRTLLVRAHLVSKSDPSLATKVLLGFIKDGDAVWFEEVDIGAFLDAKVSIQLFTMTMSSTTTIVKLTAKTSTSLLESHLCSGDIILEPVAPTTHHGLPAAIFATTRSSNKDNQENYDGTYSTDLCTTIPAEDEHSKSLENRIQVGTITVKLFQDKFRTSLRTCHGKTNADDIYRSIRETNFPLEDVLNQYGFLLVLACRNMFRAASTVATAVPLNGSSSQPPQQLQPQAKLKSLAAYLGLINRIFDTFAQWDTFHEKNLHRLSIFIISTNNAEWALKALKLYFEDYLASDSLQQLIERSSPDTVLYRGTLPFQAFLVEEEAWIHLLSKSCFALLLSRMVCILAKVQSFESNTALEAGEEEALMSKDYIREIAADLIRMTLRYQQKLVSEYMVTKDTLHLNPEDDTNKSVMKVVLQLQIIVRYLFRILPYDAELNQLFYASSKVIDSFIQYLCSFENANEISNDHRETLQQCKFMILTRLSVLGAIHASSLVRTTSRRALLEDMIVSRIDSSIAVLDGILKTQREHLQGERINFFLCELMHSLLASITKILGSEFDGKGMRALIKKQVVASQFLEDIKNISCAPEGSSLYQQLFPEEQLTGLEALLGKGAKLDSSKTAAAILSAQLQPQQSQVQSWVTVPGEPPKKTSVDRPSPIRRKEPVIVPPSSSSSKRREDAAKLLAKAELTSADVSGGSDSLEENVEGQSYSTNKGARLLVSVHELSGYLDCLLHIFVLLMRRSAYLSEQVQLTSYQLKSYLNGILVAVVNSKTIRPTSISSCFYNLFSGPQSATTSDEVQMGAYRLASLLCSIDKTYYSAMFQQGDNGKVELSATLQDLHLSLAFYQAFAHLVYNRSKSSPQQSPVQQATLGLAPVTEIYRNTEKLSIRESLFECLEVTSQELVKLMVLHHAHGPHDAVTSWGSIALPELSQCLECVALVWRSLVGIQQVPRLFRFQMSEFIISQQIFSLLYLERALSRTWLLLLRTYQIDGYEDDFISAARLYFLSNLLEVVELTPLDLLPPSALEHGAGSTSAFKSSNRQSEAFLAWRRVTRQNLVKIFQQTFYKELETLAEDSVSTSWQSAVSLSKELLMTHEESINALRRNATLVVDTSAEQEVAERQAKQTLLVDLFQALSFLQEMQSTATGNFDHDNGSALLHQFTSLLLAIRANGQNKLRVSSRSSLSPAKVLLSVAGAVSLIMTAAGSNDSPGRRIAVDHRQIQWLKQSLASLSRNSPLPEVNAVVDGPHFLDWQQLVGKSESAFLNVVYFLLYLSSRVMGANEDGSKGLVGESSHPDIALSPVVAHEKEVQAVREAVTQLLATGYWEIAAALVEFYLQIMDLKSAQDASLQLAQQAAAAAGGGHSPLPPSALSVRSGSPSRSVFTFDSMPGTPAPSHHTSGQQSPFVMSSSSRGVLGNVTPFINSPIHSPNPFDRLRKSTARTPLPPPLPTPHVNASSNSNASSRPIPAPPTIPHLSPTRNDTVKRELSRMLNKIREKMKFDGDVRLPAQYFAVRFLSNSPNFYDAELVAAGLDPFVVLRADGLNFVNGQQTAFAASSSSGLFGLQKAALYEQWYILRCDMASFSASLAHYQRYLEEEQFQQFASQSRSVMDAAYLNHPLSVPSLQALLQRSFPEYTLVPNHFNVTEMCWPLVPDPLFSTASSSTSVLNHMHTVRFMQLHPLYDADLVRSCQDDNNFLLVHATSDDKAQDEGKGEHQSGSESDEDENGIIRSHDVNDLVDGTSPSDLSSQYQKRRVKKDIDKLYVDLTQNPRSFNLYMPQYNRQQASQQSKSKSKAKSAGIGNDEVEREVQKLELSFSDRSIDAFCSSAISTLSEKQTEETMDTKFDPKPFQQALQSIGVLSLSPFNVAWQTGEESVRSIRAGVDILHAQAVVIARCIRAMKHTLSLKATELLNQPDNSILHSDNLFYYSFCQLCNILQQPSVNVVGIHNVDYVIATERDRHELRWQAIRKYAKREYMRQLTLYEEAQELNKMKVGMKKNNDTKTTASKAANDETGRGKKSTKPTEPDWDELRDAFERESGIEEVDTLEILAQHCWSEVFKLIKLMHRFAQKMVDITAQQMQQSGINARDLVQQSGKITSAALQMIRVQKLGRLSAGTEEEDDKVDGDEKVKFDDDCTLRQKMCLYLDAIVSSIEIGIDL